MEIKQNRFFSSFFLHTWPYSLMTPALIMLVIPGPPSYNGVEVYYLKGVIGLPIVISFRDRWYIHIFFFLEMGSMMTSSSSAGPIQISKFPESWCGHVECSSGAIKTAFDIQVDGKRGPGRPEMTWKQLTERDCREWKLSAINPHDRRTWRSGVRSAMRAASQLSGRGPTDVDVALVPAC